MLLEYQIFYQNLSLQLAEVAGVEGPSQLKYKTQVTGFGASVMVAALYLFVCFSLLVVLDILLETSSNISYIL